MEKFPEQQPYPYEILDYRKENFITVKNKLIELMKTGDYVFHGTNAGLFESLEPRQAFDKDSDLGRKNAIYATTYPITALMFSLLDIPKYKSSHNLKSFSWSFDRYDSSRQVQPMNFEGSVIDNVINRNDDSLFSDGVLYVLPRGQFQPVHKKDRPEEFFAEEVVTPQYAILVPGKIGKEFFTSQHSDGLIGSYKKHDILDTY